MTIINADPEVRDRVYRYLRQSIMTGQLRGGTRIVEERISEELQVSRTPVREAIQRLISHGLVARVRRGQVEVRYIEQEERDQLHLLRLAFDEVAAGLINQRTDRIDWEHLYNGLQPMADALSTSGLSSPQLAIAHLDLHIAINRAAFNDGVAASVIGQDFLYIIDPTAQPHGYDPLEAHRLLLDELRSGNQQRVLTATRAHAVLKVAD